MALPVPQFQVLCKDCSHWRTNAWGCVIFSPPHTSGTHSCAMVMGTQSSAAPYLWLTFLLPSPRLHLQTAWTPGLCPPAARLPWWQRWARLPPEFGIFSRGLPSSSCLLHWLDGRTLNDQLHCPVPGATLAVSGTVAASSCSLLTLSVWSDNCSLIWLQALKGGRKRLKGLLANSCPKKWSLLTMQKAFHNPISCWAGILLVVCSSWNPGYLCGMWDDLFVWPFPAHLACFMHRSTGSRGLVASECMPVHQVTYFCLSSCLCSVLRSV